MSTPTLEELEKLARQLPEKIPYLKLLILFGSRATGKTHAQSDWDFAVLFNEEERKIHIKDNNWGWFEVPLILGKTFGIAPEKIDVVELNNSSWLVAHFIARDGILLYEKDPGGYEYFRSTSLRPESEMKKFRQEQRQLIEMALKKWGL
ncbi:MULTISPECIES: type VII toxin-antitoxin system MntA family adenylyltransferase antitoxin [Nostocales]|uniref:Nucleotidyltransferase domain-containing protein n=3 Tax=Nostocales TaxID=1161 RepID=A0A8S9T094_9CYAN|nr:nucleotidyltransferase domain-containing protein [Tolypothrix bouteillei]KAF3885820.1 nucleotidyltransferase domain-containing protein [Tolypothrix bouteillei VB521301]